MLWLSHAQGRHVLWGWLQERRKAGSYDYSGCMTVPRLLYLEDERLIQVCLNNIVCLYCVLLVVCFNSNVRRRITILHTI